MLYTRVVTFLECEGDVINEPNIIIQHSLDVIPWFKDYRNVTLRYNLRSSEPNASLLLSDISLYKLFLM
jgi:hypothetical protein